MLVDEQESPFICKICYSSYDDDNKKPVIMTPCSHTICKSCLSNILLLNKTCPFCKKEIKGDITDVKPNYELIDILHQIKTINNAISTIKCSYCKENTQKINFIEEKNASINFICETCAKNSTDSIITIDSIIKKNQHELERIKKEFDKKINKTFITNEICNLISKYLKQTVCELIEQKSDLFETFMNLPDFMKMLLSYRQSLETILTSKENSLCFIQTNYQHITPTIKDSMINNILNLSNSNTNEKLNQKILNFETTIEKEFNKNKLYLQSVLQSLTNEIIYQSNIAIYNTFKESLKDDISLLEKLSMSNNVLNNTNNVGVVSSNFQSNHIQVGSIFSQMQLQDRLDRLGIDDLSSCVITNSMISDNNVVSVIGLMKEKHKSKDKLKKVIEDNCGCECKLYEKDNVYYGCQLVFDNKRKMERFLEKKKCVIKYEDDKKVMMFKKENKQGNRMYIKYI